MEKEKKLRLYIVDPFTDSEVSELVCAESCKEAKQITWDESDWLKECASEDDGWIGIRVRWVKKCYTKGIEKGIMDYDADTLRRCSTWWFEDVECPICKRTDRCTTYEFNETTQERTERLKDKPMSEVILESHVNGKKNFRFVGCSSCEENYSDGKLKKEDIPEKAIPYMDLENDMLYPLK